MKISHRKSHMDPSTSSIIRYVCTSFPLKIIVSRPIAVYFNFLLSPSQILSYGAQHYVTFQVSSCLIFQTYCDNIVIFFYLPNISITKYIVFWAPFTCLTAIKNSDPATNKPLKGWDLLRVAFGLGHGLLDYWWVVKYGQVGLSCFATLTSCY